ncbi:MAG: CPBP family intramembrane glutamic endopeptidase [Candidatus Thorarchaeota archaeon]
MDKIRNLVAKNQIITFFILTYVITWGFWIPFIQLSTQEGIFGVLAMIPVGWGLFGPALAGIVVTWVINPEQYDKSRKRQFLAFCLGLVVSTLVFILNSWISMALSWTPVIIIVMTFMGLMIAIPPAFIISSAFAVNQKVREYVHSLIKPSGLLVYYLIALLLPPFLFWIGSLFSNALGQTAYAIPLPLIGWNAVLTLPITFIYNFFFANTLGEEVGWRGFALPALQGHYSPLVASLIIALMWFAWHLPLIWPDPNPVPPYIFYALSFIPLSVFLTWIYNRTHGSILAVGIAHISNNVCGQLLFPITNAWLIVFFITAIILILIDHMWEGRYHSEKYAP